MNIKHHTRILFITLLCSGILAACSSVPYNRLKTPSIHGVITISGEKTQGLPLYLSIKGNDNLCYTAAEQQTTGPDGEFHFHSVKETLPREPVMKHFLDEWHVCTEFNQQRINLYSGNRYGTGSVNLSLNLKCELTRSASSGRCTPF